MVKIILISCLLLSSCMTHRKLEASMKSAYMLGYEEGMKKATENCIWGRMIVSLCDMDRELLSEKLKNCSGEEFESKIDIELRKIESPHQ